MSKESTKEMNIEDETAALEAKQFHKMTKTPIWTFHGDADGAVKYEYTKNLVEAVKKAGNDDVQFTTYPGVNHNCWTRTYDNPELYRWFLSKKLEK